VLDAHITLQKTATRAGDALMSGLVEMDDKFDKLADEIGMSSMFARTTFVHHPALPVVTAGDGGTGEGGDHAAVAAAIAAAAAVVVGAVNATPEPTLVTLIPCVNNNRGGGGGGGVGGTVTRLQLPGQAPMEWPPRSSSSSDNHYRDVVLVVAGEWLSKITKGEYPAPAVSHDRAGPGAGAGEDGPGGGAGEDGPCLHATYRA
jgi:hypothetical protein